MRHDHQSHYDYPAGGPNRQEQGQEPGAPHNRGRRRGDIPPPRPREQNYPQDRWPDFEESVGRRSLRHRTENPRDRRTYEESFNPDHYQFVEQDPRYYDEENRLRREMMREEQEREARLRERHNQFSSDRWPEQEEYRSRETDNGQRPSRRRDYGDGRQYEDQRRNRNENPNR